MWPEMTEPPNWIQEGTEMHLSVRGEILAPMQIIHSLLEQVFNEDVWCYQGDHCTHLY